ncbi:MAG TPA: hypothetical protein DEG43_14310 [Acidimicrobiaceae bacterium]|nr:hypothetical protein [Acidimicrobiaceae bacterium]
MDGDLGVWEYGVRMTSPLNPYPEALRPLLRIRAVGFGAVFLLILAGPAIVLGATAGIAYGVLLWGVGAALTIGCALWWAGLEFNKRGWQMTEDYVETRSGVIMIKQVMLPRGRVQNVTIDSGPLRRYFGLASVIVHSAGAATPNIALNSILEDEAEELQHSLIGKGRSEDPGARLAQAPAEWSSPTAQPPASGAPTQWQRPPDQWQPPTPPSGR